jgi:hypothetical protein
MEIVPGCKLHWEEIACHTNPPTPYPVDLRETVLVAKLIPAWIALRKRNGNTPISVLSAFRTVEYNRKIGGEPGSFHCFGAALDLSAGGWRPALEFAKLAVLEAREGGLIKGVGWYPDFGQTHIDVGARERLTLWRCVATYKTTDAGKRKIVRKYLPWSGEAME